MATTMYFEEEIVDQGGEHKLSVELGRSSFYRASPTPDGRPGGDSIYLIVDGKTVIMDRDTAKRFVDGVMSVGFYHGFID